MGRDSVIGHFVSRKFLSGKGMSMSEATLKQIVYIQKIWKAYQVRRKLLIYNRLPGDLQRRIIFFVRLQFYEKRFEDSLRRIVLRRVARVTQRNSSDINWISRSTDTYRLAVKYHTIMPIEKLAQLRQIAFVYSLEAEDTDWKNALQAFLRGNFD